MKLLTLKLIAYGPFTDHTIYFDAHTQGIHLLYGPNEAGKSATLRAITDLFYGIPERTNDNFIHENNALRIGARIQHSDNSCLEFLRRKGRKNTLLDDNEKILDEAIFEKYLGGVTRELFETVYGINQFTLVEGGKQLITGGGETGQSLFSAGLGIAGMHKIVEALTTETGALFKPSAKNPRINQLITQFKEIRKARAEKSLSAKDWIAHDKALKTARSEKREIEHEIACIIAQTSRLKRLRDAIPRISKLNRYKDDIRQMGDVVVLPKNFADDRRKAQETLAVAKAAQERLAKDLEGLRDEMSSITLSEVLLNNQHDITGLFQYSGSYKKANRDLPTLKAQNQSMIQEAEALLKKLNPLLAIEQADSLRITEPTLVRIRQLGRKLEPLLKSRADSERRKMGLESRLAKTKQEIGQIPAGRNPGKLKEVIEKALRQGDLTDALATAEADVKRLGREADLALQRIGLWKGSLEELEQLAVTSSVTVDKFAAGFTKFQTRIESLHQRIAEQSEAIESLNGQIEAIYASGSVLTENDLLNARKHRDQGWQLVVCVVGQQEITGEALKAFDPDATSIIDAFEKSLKQTDEISDRLRNESERVAKLTNLMANKNDYNKRLSLLEAELEQVRKENRSLEKEWEELWSAVHIKALTPKEMNAWIEQQRKLLLLANELRKRQSDVAGLRERINFHTIMLRECLQELNNEKPNLETNLDTLIINARRVMQDIEKNNNLWEKLKERIRDIEIQIVECEQDIEQINLDSKAWQNEWGSAVKQIGLEYKAHPDEADAVIDLIQDLFEKLDGAKVLQGRINAIRDDNKKFSEQVRTLCIQIGADFDAASPHKSIEDLNNRLKDALADESTLKGLRKQEKRGAEELRAQEKIIEETRARIRAMCIQAKCANPEELPALEDLSNRLLDTREKIEEIESELDRFAGGARIQELCKEAESVDVDSLPAEINRLDNQLEQLQQKRSELDQAIGREDTALKTMDGGLDASELAQKAQAILSSIEQAVERYARLHISSVILRKEIERYKDEHQGPILERASDIFEKLTIGSFKKLVSDFDDNDNQVLKGVRPRGEKISVAGMSDGTCDQLYLALRLASIEQRVKVSEPIPLILDDIFVNFDDERSKATLEVLAEISDRTQIIIFTHHLHLRELAEKVIERDTLDVHSLPIN
ncbi:MAG: AAA family ATPase [bacterium]